MDAHGSGPAPHFCSSPFLRSRNGEGDRPRSGWWWGHPLWGDTKAVKKSDHDYANARRLRRKLTLPEGLLWRELKGAPDGVRFRKQHPLGKYALDFYCARAKLAIEVDGIAHDMGDRPQRDLVRDEFVRGEGIEVVRIPATDVLASPVDVAQAIVLLCKERGA